MAKRKNESQSSMVNNHWSPATCATDLSKLTSSVMASWCLKAVFIRAKATVLVLPVFGIAGVTTILVRSTLLQQTAKKVTSLQGPAMPTNLGLISSPRCCSV